MGYQSKYVYSSANRKRRTKRDEFLDNMDDVIKWDEWVCKIRPIYPKARHNPSHSAILILLKMYLLQIWFSLSDEDVEDAIYDSCSM